MEEDDIYTNDGTVDYKGNPANKKKTGTWRTCPFIIGNEVCERLAYYGMSTNLVLYFKHQLNQHSSVAATNNQNWGGTCYITPIIGAFLADSYLGRYWTIACFSIVYIIGMTLLALSASVRGIRPRCYAEDNCNPTEVQSAMTFLALYLIALGTGGIKPCVSSYGADQFDDTDEKEKKHKSSFFNWFYLSINIGALVAGSVLVWVQDNVSWGWGLGIPAIAMAIAVCFFFSGTHLYWNQVPGGSPVTRLFQVLVASIRKYKVAVPANKSVLHETADKESNIKGSRKIDHTNDLSQMGSLFVLQGERMDTHVGHSNFKIPAASLSIFDTLSVTFWVPIYDRIIVPVTRKFTGHKNGLTQLQRMGIGLFISIFAMVVAAILEHERLKMIKRHNYHELKEMPITIFWQVPQYFLIGCAEVFTCIGQLEFFYEQAPDAMRSFCSALSLTTVALGSYLSSLLVTIVSNATAKNGKPGWIPDNLNYGHIAYFFWILAALGVFNLGVYVWFADWYTYKKAVGTLR
ncbi:hypothetical protein Goklo_010482 [Gossypium klotzschianum]|uniref:Uncharacterized protein n=1 Tax=Gossypium klotzschianum TaxID=34286 RepID=A0A7J8V723_9ROSI|nr:hypothetical protein [Gossypium klotzschianum]